MCVTLRRELMAELLEDEKVSMEFVQLEEEYRILTEENQNLITVHSQRAQQLETLRVISQKRQGSSWPLTPVRKSFHLWVFTTAYKHLSAPLVRVKCTEAENWSWISVLRLRDLISVYLVYFKLIWVYFRADGLVAQTWAARSSHSYMSDIAFWIYTIFLLCVF